MKLICKTRQYYLTYTAIMEKKPEKIVPPLTHLQESLAGEPVINKEQQLTQENLDRIPNEEEEETTAPYEPPAPAEGP
jgi:hypothetical protein